MLPCTLSLRLSQIVGREHGGIARLARGKSFHRGQRHAGGPLLAQMLRSDQFLKQRHRIQHIYAIRMLLPFQLTYVLSLILEELIHGIL